MTMSWMRIVKSAKQMSDELDKVSKVGDSILHRVLLMNGDKL